MSLREDFSGVCTGGFNDDMATVYQAGVDYIGTTGVPGTVFAVVQAGLTSAAASGTSTFTVTADVSFEDTNLKLAGVHQQTFFAGIIDALAAEGIYSMYVSLLLNTADAQQTKVDFNFTL